MHEKHTVKKLHVRTIQSSWWWTRDVRNT